MADAEESVTRQVDPLADSELASDWMLRGCATVLHEGRRHPTLGRITLLERIGRGGMGVVYRGHNPRLGTDVAVKLLPPALEQSQAEFVDRFVREARLAAKLRSEHLVTVVDVDCDESTKCHFLVMEYVRGITASKWVEDAVAAGRAGTRESDALDVCIAATKGLAAAHLEGVVHRDVKPGNILLPFDEGGRPALARAKLADLGLARGEAGGEASLTGTQIALGTPGYMAPEQAQDAHGAKKPADTFSMGATLYAFLTGSAPFRASTPVEAIVRTVKGEFKSLRDVRTDVSEPTAVVVERCLAQDPLERYPDATALLEALQICRKALGAGSAEAAEAAGRVAALAGITEHGKPVPVAPRAADSPRRADAAPRTAVNPISTRTVVAPSRTLPPIRSNGSRAALWAAAAVAVIAGLGVVFWKRAPAEPVGRDVASAPPVTAPPVTEHVTERPAVEEKPEPAAAPAAADPAPIVLEKKPLARDRDATARDVEDRKPPKTGPSASDRLRSGGATNGPASREPDPPIAQPPATPRTEPLDPIEAAQEFDLGGLPGREDSFTEQQIRKLARAHRRGDLAGAATLQRTIAQFYMRIGDTARFRIARDRAEILEAEVRAKTASTAPAEGAPKQPSSQAPSGSTPPQGESGGLPPPPPPGQGPPPPPPPGKGPPPPPPRR